MAKEFLYPIGFRCKQWQAFGSLGEVKKTRVPAHDQSHDLDDSRDRPGHPPAGLSRNSWGSLFSLLPGNVSNHVKPSQNSFKTFSDAQYLRRRTKVIMWGKDLSCSMLRLVFRVWQLKL